jgi:hypothetical protein
MLCDVHISKSVFVTKTGATSNSISAGFYGSAHGYIEDTQIIQWPTNHSVTAAVSTEGAEDTHWIGNTIINLDTNASSEALDLSGSSDTEVAGNTIQAPTWSLITNNSTFPTINAVIHGNSFLSVPAGGAINLSGLNDNFSGNTLSNVTLNCVGQANVVANYLYYNNATSNALVIQPNAPAWASNIDGNSMVCTGSSGGNGINVSDPGTTQVYPLSIVGNNIQGFTNNINWAGASYANLTGKKVWGNPGVPDFSPNSLSIGTGGSTGAGVCWKAGGTLGYCTGVGGVCTTCN